MLLSPRLRQPAVSRCVTSAFHLLSRTASVSMRSIALNRLAIAVLCAAVSMQGQAPATNIGTTSATQTATVTITTAGSLSDIAVLTRGATGLDFQAVTPNTAATSCTVGTFYEVGDTCTVQYTFSPVAPWTRQGAVRLGDSRGNVLGQVFLSGVGIGPQVSFPLNAYSPRTRLINSDVSSGLGYSGIAVDGRGDVYLALSRAGVVEEIVAVNGVVSSSSTVRTLGGNDSFIIPVAVAVDGAGNVYVADVGNRQIDEIVAVDGVVPSNNPSVQTLASGFTDLTGIAVDGSGNVYFSDGQSPFIGEIVAVNGVIPANPTINHLGSETAQNVAVDAHGDVFYTSRGVKELVAVNGSVPLSNPTVRTLGSLPGGPGLAVDGSGNVYVGISGDAAGGSLIILLAVDGTVPTSEPGVVFLGSWNSPAGLAVDASGNLFVLDIYSGGPNSGAWELSAQTPPSLSFAATAVGVTSSDSPKTVTIANNGNAPLLFPVLPGNNPSLPATFSLNNSYSYTCPMLTSNSFNEGSLAAGASCWELISFTPTMAGTITGSSTVTDNNLNATGATQSIFLSGIATKGTPTVDVGQPDVPVNSTSVTLVADISTAGVPSTGAVTFTVNGGSAIAATCTGSSSPIACSATYNPSALTVGSYTIVAKIAADNNYNSASGSGTLTIAQGTPTLSLTTSRSTSKVNQTVTFTASVSPTSGITPSGKVSFSTTLNGTSSAIPGCTSVALVSGKATCTTSSLQAGSNSVVASLAADSNFTAASSNALTQTVNTVAPTVTLTSSNQSSTVNSAVTFTATVSPSSGVVPTGAVSFTTTLNGSTSPITGCTSVALSGGAATCTTSALTVGTYSVTATLAADANFLAQASNTVPETIGTATPSLAVTPTTTSTAVGAAVTFTATATLSHSGPIFPTGKVSFSTTVSGATTVIPECSSVALDASTLKAVCTTYSLKDGANSVTATLAADTNFGAVTSAAVSDTVTQAATTLAVTSSLPVSSTVNQAVTFTATLSATNPFTIAPGGTVGFTVGGVTIPGCAIAPVNATTHAATCTTSSLVAPSDVIAATYTGDANFSGSTATALTQVVNKNTPVNTVVSSLTSSIVNQNVTFSATITPTNASASGLLPTGSITFIKGSGGPTICNPTITSNSGSGTATASCTVPFTSAFSATGIYAVYSGDQNFSAGNSPNVSQTVNPAPTTTTVTSAMNPSVATQSVNLMVSLSLSNSGVGYSGTALPQSGTIVFTDSSAPSTPFCLTTVTGGVIAVATCAHAFSTPGSHTVTAAFTSTDANFSSSMLNSGVIQSVTPLITPSISFSIPNHTYGDAPFTVAATSNSTGALSYSVASGNATVTPGGLVTLTGIGPVTIAVSQSAAGNYTSGTGSATLNVSRGTATVTLSNLTQTYTGSPLPITATTTPTGLNVSITYAGSPTAPTAAGSYAIVATIADANYTGTTSGTLFIQKATATVTLSNLTQTYTGSSLPITATTTPTGLNVTVSYAGSPTAPTAAGSYAIVATIADANYTGTASGTLFVQKATATVNLSNLTQTYTGSPLPITATTTPTGLNVSITYAGSATAPTAAGSYAIVATVADANYTGTASGTLFIQKATAAITLSNLTQTYTGSPLPITATTTPTGLNVSITYAGSATAPTAAGSYAIVATIADANYTGTASGTLFIQKATATVTLSNLTQTYTGLLLPITAATTPTGLNVNVSYAGSPTAPTAAGSYAIVATVADANYTGTASGTLFIQKATATVTLSNLTQTYTGSLLPITAATTPTGLNVNVSYAGSPTAPTAAGSYAIVATIADANYTGTASGTLFIQKATATVTLSNLTQTYTGSLLPITATTTPTGLNVSITYAGSPTAPTAAGSYAIVATIADANYTGTASGTLFIQKATATITLSNLTQTYTGSSLPITATTTPTGLNVSITYAGSATAPTAAGSYAIVATVADANYTGTASGTLFIQKATATITLSNLNQTYTGSPLPVTATTTPTGLNVSITYAGSATAPTAAGSYAIVATVADANYTGTASGTLFVQKATATVSVMPTSVSAAYGSDEHLTIAVTPTGAAAAHGATPTGTVTVIINGTVATVALANGDGTYDAGILPSGPYTVTANYNGDTDYTGTLSSSSTTPLFTITTGSLLVTANNATRVFGNANPTFSGNVSGQQNGDTFTETFTTTAVPASPAGSYPIVPQVAGSNLADYTVSAGNGTLTITRAATTTTAVLSANSITTLQTLTVTATVQSSTTGTPTGSVQLLDGTSVIATTTLNGTTAIFSVSNLAAGAHSLSVAYLGDTNFTASTTPTSLPVTVNVADFVFTTNGTESQTVIPGQTAKYTFQISPEAGGYPGIVTFTVSGLPPGATAVFTPNNIPVNGGPQTVTLAITTASLTAAVQRSLPPRGSLPILLGFLLLPLTGIRRIRRLRPQLGRVLSLLVLLGGSIASLAALTGCGSGNGFFTQPQQSYSVTVTMTSGPIVHTVNVNLTVE